MWPPAADRRARELYTLQWHHPPRWPPSGYTCYLQRPTHPSWSRMACRGPSSQASSWAWEEEWSLWVLVLWLELESLLVLGEPPVETVPMGMTEKLLNNWMREFILQDYIRCMLWMVRWWSREMVMICSDVVINKFAYVIFYVYILKCIRRCAFRSFRSGMCLSLTCILLVCILCSTISNVTTWVDIVMWFCVKALKVK